MTDLQIANMLADYHKECEAAETLREKADIQFKHARLLREALQPKVHEEKEPYFGWCDVEGCESEGVSGGSGWRKTGYWTLCRKHSADSRDGKAQPKMKQSAIDREKRRGEDGVLKTEP